MSKKKISVVCIANYCRSPVAEMVFKKHLNLEKFSIISCGLNPMQIADMDARSRKYLSIKGYEKKIHNPKRVNNAIVDDCDYIFALDIQVLIQLKKTFPKKLKNIYLLNEKNRNLNLADPYLFNDEKQYFEVMANIEKCTVDLCHLIDN